MRLRDAQYTHSDSVSHVVRFLPSPVTAVHKLPNYSIPREQLEQISKLLVRTIECLGIRMAEAQASFIKEA